LLIAVLIWGIRYRRSRARLNSTDFDPEHLEDEQSPVVSRAGDCPAWGVASAAVTANAVANKAARGPDSVVVGKKGRFFRCSPFSVGERKMTRVVEVDRTGTSRGEVKELSGDVREVLGRLI
jgi:hypothetical protein